VTERSHVWLVPHTHWDREWYEPFAVFSERLETMMDALLDLGAAGFPHFHLDGQTAMIDDYLARRPERADELAALVRSGQLSAGPWVTQMDEFLTSGESHIRNLEMGLRRAEELGAPLRLGYMPDQFGHIGQMPQILRLAAIDRAMVWRGVPAEMDRTSFRWRAPDGSEVVTEYMLFGYANGSSFERAADPAALEAAIAGSVDALRPHAVDDRIVVMVGYDHAGPDATLPERLADPSVRIAGLASFLEGRSEPEDLPVWTGELRSSARAHLLPNVYSARVHQKRERGRVEALLERYAEPLAALVPGFGWPEDELRHAWRLLLWNGAHDSACGCSHDQVAIDVDSRFADVREICEDVMERALTSLGSRVDGEPGVIRFNPSPFERDAVPALGYRVVPAGHEPEEAPVTLEPLDDRVLIDGLEVRVLDEPDIGDLYNFCYADEGQVPSPPTSVQVRGHEVVAAWDRLLLLARVTRRADEPFFRLEGVIRNERPDHRLRLQITLPTAADGSIAGSPFELVPRPLVGEGSDAEAASRTWPARHVAVAGGIGILHEGVFEYEVVDGRSLAISLLRCVGRISGSFATRPWDAGPRTPTPGAQMIGETAFAMGIWPGAPTGAELLAGWERFALPIAEAPAAGGGSRPRTGTLLSTDLGEAQLSSVRRHEDRVQVRVWNPGLDPVVARIGTTAEELGAATIATSDVHD
jgi:alpha-mannosidase